MAARRFEWDPRKAETNYAKHGIAFSEAISAFDDDTGFVLEDPDHSAAEERFILLGLNTRQRVLVVVFCHRSGGTTIRLISARLASRSERAQYRARNA